MFRKFLKIFLIIILFNISQEGNFAQSMLINGDQNGISAGIGAA